MLIPVIKCHLLLVKIMLKTWDPMGKFVSRLMHDGFPSRRHCSVCWTDNRQTRFDGSIYQKFSLDCDRQLTINITLKQTGLVPICTCKSY